MGTQTTAIDIAQQNSEVTVSPPRGGGGDCKRAGDYKGAGRGEADAGFQRKIHSLLVWSCVPISFILPRILPASLEWGAYPKWNA